MCVVVAVAAAAAASSFAGTKLRWIDLLRREKRSRDDLPGAKKSAEGWTAAHPGAELVYRESSEKAVDYSSSAKAGAAATRRKRNYGLAVAPESKRQTFPAALRP